MFAPAKNRNTLRTSLGARIRLLAQDLYLLVMREHLFETLHKLPESLSILIIKIYYGRRVWDRYPIFKTAHGKELIFVHVPKCAGTSVARALGKSEIRHLPAMVLRVTDRNRFDKAITFAIVRDPLDRIGSILLHFRDSEFSSYVEHCKANKYGISEDNLDVLVRRYITERGFKVNLFSFTTAGRSGLSAKQEDYVTQNGKVIVNMIFKFTELDLLSEWLAEMLGANTSLRKENASNRSKKFTPSKETIEVANKEMSGEYRIFKATCTRDSRM